MTAWHDLLIGFSHVFEPYNMLMLVIGIVAGMMVSIMPGLGFVMGVILALPFTYKMQIEPAIILLTAIYFSGTYGGCFTTILYRIPGEPSDVPLLWDGYTMGQRVGVAKPLGWALVAALIGGLVSSVAMVALTRPLTDMALHFNSEDYFAVIVLGLTTVVALAGKALAKAIISLCLGLLVACIGVDSIYGVNRFTFGVPVLGDGVQLVAVLVGMYGLGEIFKRLGQGLSINPVSGDSAATVRTDFPRLSEIWAIKGTIIRSSVIGTLLGVVPGAGATITSFICYGTEKQYGRDRRALGTGHPSGIVAPQIGSTASVAGHLIPMLTLGIPGSAATAVILAAFLLHGVQPGPMLLANPASRITVYTILASMFVSVIGMCVIGFFWIRVVVRVLLIPQYLLNAIVVLFCLVGAYADRNSISDVWMILIFGMVGYLFEKFDFPIAPMVLGAILGPIGESNFMRSMIVHHGHWTAFFTQRLSAALLMVSAVAFLLPVWRTMRDWFRRRRQQRPKPDGGSDAVR
jgi:putative tricarboxylic transport membrane protein